MLLYLCYISCWIKYAYISLLRIQFNINGNSFLITNAQGLEQDPNKYNKI